MPDKREKTDRSSGATRDRLLAAAIRVFAARGYSDATVREICGHAGANVNAVNYHFHDKETLYVEAVKAAHRAIRSGPGLDLIDQIAERFDGDPEERLLAFVTGVVSMAMNAEVRSDVNHQLMFREMGQPTVATEQIVREFIKPQFERLQAILRALLPEGVAPLDVRLLALSVFGQCLHYKFAGPVLPLLLTKADARRLTLERVARHITDVTLAAIRSRGDASPSPA